MISSSEGYNELFHIDSLVQLIESPSTSHFHSKQQSLQTDISSNYNGYHDIFRCIQHGDLKAIKKCLLSMHHYVVKLNLDHRSLSLSGRTILQEACAKNQIEIVKFLLENYYHGRRNNKITNQQQGQNNMTIVQSDHFEFDIDKKSHIGQDTALHFAVRNDNKVITRVLLNCSANPNIPNKYGATPFHYVQSIDIAHLLRSYGADSTLVDKNGRTPKLYKAYYIDNTATRTTPVIEQKEEEKTLETYLIEAEQADTKDTLHRLRVHRRLKKEKSGF